MHKKHKGKAFMVLAGATAAILAIGVWNNYRPTVVMANCAKVADQASRVYTRVNLETDETKTYEELLQECVNDFENR